MRGIQNVRRRAGGPLRFFHQIQRRLRHAISPPPIILCYHRIFEPETDPHLLSVSPDHFRQHLEVVNRIAHPLSLGELSLLHEREDLPRRGVVITFDDGYRDNLENALPILRAAEVPATIYIATGNVGSDREFWWDDLERLVLGGDRLPKALYLTIDGRTCEWEMGSDIEADPEWNVLANSTPNGRQQTFCKLHVALRPIHAVQQQEVLEQLRQLSGASAEARPDYRSLTGPELKTLSREALVTLGAHTISHCDLKTRTKAEQQHEIVGSKEQLEKIIGRPVEHFSYPYGSCNDDSVTVCSENNFRSAVTCIDQPIERKTPQHLLPRFLVRNWDGAEFERRLQSFFTA